MRQAWPLLAGLALLGALWLGPLPGKARFAFSPHMMLHLGVAVVAAPLIVTGLSRLRLSKQGIVPSWPLAIVASVSEMCVVWGWHVPVLHEAAALDSRIFAAQQVSFLLVGLAVWGVGAAVSTRADYGIAAATLLFTSMHMAMLGVLLALAPRLLYSPSLCLGAFGLDRLEDQRLGGALMAVGGSMPYLLGGTLAAYRFLSVDRDRT